MKGTYLLLKLFNHSDADGVHYVEVGSVEGDGPISSEVLYYILGDKIDLIDAIGDRWTEDDAWHVALVLVWYGEIGEYLSVEGEFDVLRPVNGFVCELEDIYMIPRPPEPEPVLKRMGPFLWETTEVLTEDQIPF